MCTILTHAETAILRPCRTKKNQGMKWIRHEKRLAIYLRDGLACVYCGASVLTGAKLTLDHVKPYSKGGVMTDEKNLATCCLRCNISKFNTPVHQFINRLAGYLNVQPNTIKKHLRNCLKRKINIPYAKNIINRQGSYSKAIELLKQQ